LSLKALKIPVITGKLEALSEMCGIMFDFRDNF